jgi:hypothetical protein
MGNWAVVLSDSALLVVALGGGVLTLVRMRRVGGAGVALASVACAVLVLAAIFDMIWWLAVYPHAIEAEDFSSAGTLNDIGVLATWLMITIGVGVLFGAVNVSRAGAAEPTTAPQPGFATGIPSAQPPAYGPPVIPQQPQPQAHSQAQPAAGWTPPQQTGQPDWNIHSGVWSIPRGTFDGPPPEQPPR